jgi:hypothetical protein
MLSMSFFTRTDRVAGQAPQPSYHPHVLYASNSILAPTSQHISHVSDGVPLQREGRSQPCWWDDL